MQAGPVQTPRRHVVKAGDLRVAVSAARAADERARAADAAHTAEIAAARAEGYAAGRADAEADGRAASPRIADALERLVAETARQQAAAAATTSREVTAAALEIAAWVLRAEVTGDGRSLAARVEEALAGLLPGPVTVLSCSDADLPAVRAFVARRGGRSGGELVVECDHRLGPGDMRVLAGHGSADLTLDTALARAADVLGVGAPGLEPGVGARGMGAGADSRSAPEGPDGRGAGVTP